MDESNIANAFSEGESFEVIEDMLQVACSFSLTGFISALKWHYNDSLINAALEHAETCFGLNKRNKFVDVHDVRGIHAAMQDYHGDFIHFQDLVCYLRGDIEVSDGIRPHINWRSFARELVWYPVYVYAETESEMKYLSGQDFIDLKYHKRLHLFISQ